MKGIYLAAYTAKHSNYNMDYNDIKQTAKHINIIGDMLNIDLSKYDYIIATPHVIIGVEQIIEGMKVNTH